MSSIKSFVSCVLRNQQNSSCSHIKLSFLLSDSSTLHRCDISPVTLVTKMCFIWHAYNLILDHFQSHKG